MAVAPTTDETQTPAPVAVRSKAEIFAQLDSQRRLRLARGISLLFGILAAVFAVPILLSYLTTPVKPPVSFTVFNATDLFLLQEITDVALAGVLIAAYLAAQREQVEFAVNSITATFVFGTILFELAQFISAGKMDATGITSFIPLNTIIVLIGLLADPLLIVATTLVLNLFVIITVQIMPLDPSLPFHKIYLQSTLPTLQWGVTIVMLAAWRNYQATFRDLGESQMAIDRARQLDDLKNQFITTVNHELRNPVMAMQGYVELFRLTADKLPPPERAALIDQASVAGKDLVALLQSILDARRMDQGADAFVPTTVEVRPTIDAAVRLIDPREGNYQERDLLLSIPPGLAIWGEPVRLQQILTNLISNALKYSPMGTPIEVGARMLPGKVGRRGQHGPPQVQITVRDYGLGIPPEQIPLLFNRFVRLPRDLASRVVGNGLGLYLCKELTEAMGGTIWLESTGIEGEGSTFYVQLPAPPTLR